MENCKCVYNNLAIQTIVLVLILILIFYVYRIFHQNEYLLNNSRGYMGHPSVDSVNDSGADLRILGQQFTSTDQGN